MVQILYAMLYSFSANLDNIAIGLSYGIKNAKIPFNKNIVIAIFTCIITLISMFIGNYLSYFIPSNIANILGSGTLILIGISSIIKEVIESKKEKKVFEDKTPNTIDFKDIITIITVLSLNNIATGVAASISGVNIFAATLFTFIFSIIFISFGNFIGIKSINNKFIEKYSNIISAFLIILVGILEL